MMFDICFCFFVVVFRVLMVYPVTKEMMEMLDNL